MNMNQIRLTAAGWAAHLKYSACAHRKEKLLALGLGLVLALILGQFTSFSSACAAVRADTLRLHILANSDTDADQSLKLAVRDAILREAGDLFSAGTTKAQAVAAARGALPALQRIAETTLRAHGCGDTVTVRLENLYFSTRAYDGFTLPAGRYDAVRVEIGAHEGKNWFCVLYPPLCLPAASGGGAAYTPEEEKAVRCPYQIRFAAVEWLESLKELFAA